MGTLDELSAELKKQKGQHYRFISQSPENIARKKYRGYTAVLASDPEVQGTILAKDQAADGTVRFGNLVLARIPEEQAQGLRDKNTEKLNRQLRMIERTYHDQTDKLKREIGKGHAVLKPIFRKEE